MQTYKIELPFKEEDLRRVKAGDMLLLSGDIYTARDAAHKRLIDAIDAGTNQLPLENSVIYYVGPTPSFGSHIVGSAGPTTSSRMDKFTEQLMENGVRATIGKGDRAPRIAKACQKYKGLYLVATGGVGALLSSKITKYEELMYADLGPESIKRLKLKEFPVYVAYDIYGNDIFKKS